MLKVINRQHVLLHNVVGGFMRRQRVISKPTKIDEMPFEVLYSDLSQNWEQKARRLQARRWRRLRQSIKGVSR